MKYLSITCAKCGAPAGEECKRNKPYVGSPHHRRALDAGEDLATWAQEENRRLAEWRRRKKGQCDGA